MFFQGSLNWDGALIIWAVPKCRFLVRHICFNWARKARSSLRTQTDLRLSRSLETERHLAFKVKTGCSRKKLLQLNSYLVTSEAVLPSHLICLLSSLSVYDIQPAQMNAFKESCYFLNNNPIRNMARTIIGTVPVQILCSNTVEPLGTDTSPVRTVSKVPTKFSYIFFQKTSIIRTTDTKSRPQRVNSYKLMITSLLRTLR